MLFKSIYKKLTYSILDDGFAIFFQEKISPLMVLKQRPLVQSFGLLFISLTVLIYKAQLQLFPKLIANLIQ